MTYKSTPKPIKIMSTGYIRKGQDEKGIKCYKEAIGINPDNFDAWNNIESLFSKKEEYSVMKKILVKIKH